MYTNVVIIEREQDRRPWINVDDRLLSNLIHMNDVMLNCPEFPEELIRAALLTKHKLMYEFSMRN